MYATCIFCHHYLGHNEVVEAFPVGRRLAFDARKGRLWVVCRRCERWNLTPLEERWEAIEECERQFRAARLRVTGESIGLAKLREGLELVRIGDPLRPEFVTWRYGSEFRRRRRRAIMLGGGAMAVAGAALFGVSQLGGGLVASVWTARLLQHWGQRLVRMSKLRHGATIPLDGQSKIELNAAELGRVSLVYDRSHTEGWYLNLPDRRLSSYQAMRATALLMPQFNIAGASARLTRHALERLDIYDGPSDFLRSAAFESFGVVHEDDVVDGHIVAGREHLPGPLVNLRAPTRLAVEIVVNEEHERIALEGELALLELAWKEAEEVAAIADNLLLPQHIENALNALRRR